MNLPKEGHPYKFKKQKSKFDYNSNLDQGLDIIEVRHIDKMDSGPAKANRFYFYYIRGGFVFILYGLLDV